MAAVSWDKTMNPWKAKDPWIHEWDGLTGAVDTGAGEEGDCQCCDFGDVVVSAQPCCWIADGRDRELRALTGPRQKERR
jgi:hypothetical protein